MDQPLFSNRWYRVQHLRPSLRSHVEFKRQIQRGEPWYLLYEPGSERMQRLNGMAYQFVGRCDGRLTVQQIWAELLAARPEESMTQDEVVQLLIQLHERGLLQTDVTPDVESIFHAQKTRQGRARRQGVNPLAFRLPLGDPSWLLDRFRRVTPLLFSQGALLVWLIVVGVALLAAALHWGELASDASKVLSSPRYVFMTWLMYPFIKAAHELAHGLAIRRWGGTVRQAGVTLFLLSPVPFVNASSADGFRHHYQRAIVSAAGIMAELLFAALAMGVWLAVQPGLVRDLAFIVMLIGGASTLLTNGNPLLRFDGYFFFCDVFDLRNLATRSGRWWELLLSAKLLGRRPQHAFVPLPGELPWLIAYAPLSWLYRLGLSIGIAMLVGRISTLLGVVVGVVMLASVVIDPLRALWNSLRDGNTGLDGGGHPFLRGIALLGVLVAALVLVPVPFGTRAEGIVWLPDGAQIRAEADGFISRFAAADGQRVKAGDLLVVMGDELLDAARAHAASKAVELDVQLFDAVTNAPLRAPALREQLAVAQAEVARIDEKIAHLQLRAGADGIVVMPHQAELVGSFHTRGDSIGHLLTDQPMVVRVALPQQDAALVRSQLKQIHVRLAEDGHVDRTARLQQDMPNAVNRLPSAALGDRSGGRIAIEGDDKDGLKTRMPVVLMDVAIDTPAHVTAAADRLGGRAQVRFDHGTLPLAGQALRALQQLVLQHFNPGT